MRHIEAPRPGAHRTHALATTPNSRRHPPRRTAQEAEVEAEVEVEAEAQEAAHSCRRPCHRPCREGATEWRGVRREKAVGTAHPPLHHLQ